MSEAQIQNRTTHESYTKHQIAYLAHALTFYGSAEENLSKSLASAKVDMNPHQVEAALFALRSPLSQGVLLADEVGLGKTIEACLVIVQRWAEGHRKIILIVPAMIRNQWSQEMLEKFNIPSYIVESSFYNARKKEGVLNPFDVKEDRILICSYEFAFRKDVDLKNVSWDLVVFDEAHKLRNVWKKKGAKIAKCLQKTLESRKKILLSATPLQNSLLELYGLVSVIDPHFFGDVESFKAQYVGAKTTAASSDILRQRLSKICYRTLRSKVQQEGVIKFTNRHSMVEEFHPFPKEKELYDKISAYLQRGDIAAIKPRARTLVTLVIRKILASSSFAICGTLDKMITRLEKNMAVSIESLDDYETAGEVAETADEVAEEVRWESEEATINQAKLHNEIEELKSYRNLAQSIQKNAKGEALLTVLDRAFSKVRELGGQRKAVIFTESCRTQQYLKGLLEANGYRGELALLNGSNSDPESKRIYKEWRVLHAGSDKILRSNTADMKAAIIEEFKNKATILISTEAGAEGVNMQFCSLLINYDLPWNPQRIEQRIGRVHRYGQKCDVVIVNFLNKGNKADERVFELLNIKLKLFEGIFGASDEVLGAIESEISFEQRINDIYQKCRNTEQIEREFEQLQSELDEIISIKEKGARKLLLENFDEEVSKNLKGRKEKTEALLSKYGEMLKLFCLSTLPHAEHRDDGFTYGTRDYYYYDWKYADEENGCFAKVDAPLIAELIEQAKKSNLTPTEITFDYDGYGRQLADLKNMRGESGWLRLSKVTTDSFSTKEELLFSAISDDGHQLDKKQCERLMMLPTAENKFDLLQDKINKLGEDTGRHLADYLRLVRLQDKIDKPGEDTPDKPPLYQCQPPSRLDELEKETVDKTLQDISQENEYYFDEEYEKLEAWGEDVKTALDIEIKKLDEEIKEAKKQAYKLSLQEKIEARRAIKSLEKRRDKKHFDYHDTCRDVDKKKGDLLAEVEKNMKPTHKLEEIFTIRWNLI